jgi:hypothetical protein
LKTKLRPQKITNQRTSKHTCKNHLPRGVEPLAEFNVQANWTKSFVKKIAFCIKENTHNKRSRRQQQGFWVMLLVGTHEKVTV